MTNPLDELLKKYQEQLVLIQEQKEEAKKAYELACKNEDRYQGAIIGVKDAQAQLLSTEKDGVFTPNMTQYPKDPND